MNVTHFLFCGLDSFTTVISRKQLGFIAWSQISDCLRVLVSYSLTLFAFLVGEVASFFFFVIIPYSAYAPRGRELWIEVLIPAERARYWTTTDSQALMFCLFWPDIAKIWYKVWNMGESTKIT
jgi:hypothetical protein